MQKLKYVSAAAASLQLLQQITAFAIQPLQSDSASAEPLERL